MKKLFSSTKAYLLLAGAAALMASCQDYEPANEQMTKEAAYNYEFERQFGPVDPNHDWSMATRVTANIDLSDAPEGTYEVKIFSEKNGYLLTKAIVENSAQISFDAIKGENSVRILARKTSALGLSVINGYFPIVDGEVNTAKEGTRAPSTATQCNTTVGDAIDLGTYVKQGVATFVYQAETLPTSTAGNALASLPQNDNIYYFTKISGENYSEGANGKYKVTYNGTASDYDMYQIGELINDASKEKKYYFSGRRIYIWQSDWNHDWDDYDDIVEENGTKYRWVEDDYITLPYNQGGVPAHYQATTENVTVKWAGDFYYLNDVYKSIESSTQVKFDDLLPLVSSNSAYDPIFHEAEDNRAKFEDVLDFDVELVLKENGPMTYTYVFYGSIYHNMLGYFYWNETEGMTPAEKKEARMKAPRYVLMEDTWPETETETGKPNLQCYGDQNGADPHTPGGMSMPTWVDSGIATHTGHYLQGTTYHMVYFGENYDQAGSYTFPAGTHVAFFLLTKATSNDANAGNKGTGLFYSKQDMNNDEEVFEVDGTKYFVNNKHWWASEVNGHYNESEERPNEGEVAAVFYSYKGNMVLGFEDDVDKDENDMLFLISAPVTPPIELSEEDEMTWIVACEDLGGTYDYDFNDLVFELTKDEITTTHKDPETGAIIDQTTTIEWFIRALAAGGTLPATVYYDNTAIGEIHSLLGSSDTGTPINVSPGTTPSIGTPVKLENVAVADQNEISKILGHIKIVVENKDENLNAYEIKAPNKDVASNIPQMLLLPKGWDWPAEQTLIYKVYPKFENWAADMTQNAWIEDPTVKGINTSFFIVNPNK